MFGFGKQLEWAPLKVSGPAPASLPQAPSVGASYPPVRRATWDGEKFRGGYGETWLFTQDYWTLRQRSAELFRSNLYARGLIRRLVTNEIATGLGLEAMPVPFLTGLDKQQAVDWSEHVETLFLLWGENEDVCDYQRAMTFGELQATIRRESLIEGDGVVVMVENQRTTLPAVRWICGNKIQTPWGKERKSLRAGHEIRQGVELDKKQRHVAYWVRQEDNSFRRVPCFGAKSGKHLAWMVYGTDKRHDDVRGEPLLALILQSIKEIDRYRDSTQRKATVNSLLAMFVERTQDKAPSGALTGGAVRKGTINVVDNTDDAIRPQSYQVAELSPGTVVERLEPGETIKAHGAHGTDEKFGEFEETIIHALAWCNQVPPEILRLAFSNNYSASQAAINEFKIYLEIIRKLFGAQVCQPIYREWLLSAVLRRTVQAPGFLDAWRTGDFYVYAGWLHADWSGHIKPSTDVLKQAKGYRMLIEDGLITRGRAARELTGTKFSQNIDIARNELELMREAGLMPSTAKPTGQLPPDPDDESEDDEEEEDEEE